METRNIQSVSIDIRKRSIVGVVTIPQFVQGDTNVLKVTILENGQPADLSGIGRVVANFKRNKDKNVTSRLVSITDNVVTYNIGQEETLKDGTADVEIQFFSLDNTKRLSTLRFKVHVTAQIGSDEIISNDPEYTLLQQLFIEVGEIEEEATTQAQYAKDQGDYAKEAAESTMTNWLSPVANYTAVQGIPNPQHGDTVQALDNGYVYRYERGMWNYTQGYGATALADVNAQLADKAQKISRVENLDKTVFTSNLKTYGFIHVMGGVDSLTNGAGGQNYYVPFAGRMKGEFGQGGTGYAGFNVSSGVDSFGAVTSSGFSLIRDLTPGSGYSSYSFDNKGVYVDSPTGTETYKHDLSLTSYDYVTLYYLKQPSGGSFDVFYDADASTTTQTVNTVSATNDIGSIELGVKKGTSGIRINNCTGGKICIFGVFLKNKAGFIYSPIGKGGDKLQWHNATNSTFREKWLDLLKPDVFIFNGGMNDRSDLDASQYDSILRSYLQPFLNKSVQLIVCRPNPVNSGENIIQSYEEKLIQYTNEKRASYMDIKALFGDDYVTAYNLGYMQGDGVHPSELGCRKIANALLEKFDVPKIGVSYAVNEDPIKNRQYITPLSTTFKMVDTGLTETIYKLGFKNSWTNGIVEIEVTGFRVGTTDAIKKRIAFTFQCATVLNSCSAVKTVTVTDGYSNASSFTFDVTAVLENGFAVVKIVSPSLKINVVSEGKVTYYDVGIGKNVWENPI